MGAEFIHTLSKREIFMAFIVAESTSIGGPSSNTSLINSLPWFCTSTTGFSTTWCCMLYYLQCKFKLLVSA